MESRQDLMLAVLVLN